MTNHPNRSTTQAAFVVRNERGEEFPNLRGVFRRVFPIAVGNVRSSGKTETVRYHNEFYTISLQ